MKPVGWDRPPPIPEDWTRWPADTTRFPIDEAARRTPAHEWWDQAAEGWMGEKAKAEADAWMDRINDPPPPPYDPTSCHGEPRAWFRDRWLCQSCRQQTHRQARWVEKVVIAASLVGAVLVGLAIVAYFVIGAGANRRANLEDEYYYDETEQYYDESEQYYDYPDYSDY